MSIRTGVRVKLTETLWVNRGLVNGAIGTVRDIVWPANTEDPRRTSPLAPLVSFDHYDYVNGPSIQTRHGTDTLANPIFSVIT